MTAGVCRQGGGVIVVHAHHGVPGSIPVSQTFTARIFECNAIPLESGKRTAAVRSEYSVKPPPPPAYRLQPPSRNANIVLCVTKLELARSQHSC